MQYCNCHECCSVGPALKHLLMDIAVLFADCVNILLCWFGNRLM
jgi:hypothetical protein